MSIYSLVLYLSRLAVSRGWHYCTQTDVALIVRHQDAALTSLVAVGINDLSPPRRPPSCAEGAGGGWEKLLLADVRLPQHPFVCPLLNGVQAAPAAL